MEKIKLSSRKDMLDVLKQVLEPNPKLRHQEPYVTVTTEVLGKLLQDFDQLCSLARKQGYQPVFKRLRMERLEADTVPKFLQSSATSKKPEPEEAGGASPKPRRRAKRTRLKP